MGKFKPYGSQNIWGKSEPPEPHDILIKHLKSEKYPLVKVLAGEHANMDSLPFRYGIHFKSDGYLMLSGIRNVEPGRRDGFVELDATFETRDLIWGAVDKFGNPVDETHAADPETYRALVLVKSLALYVQVVTVWRNDGQDEFYLSELMKRLRKAGRLTPEVLLDLHPRYLSGELTSMESLFSALLDQGSVSGISELDMESMKSELRDEYENEIKRVHGIATQAIEGLKAEEARGREKDDEIEAAEQLGLVEKNLNAIKQKFKSKCEG